MLGSEHAKDTLIWTRGRSKGAPGHVTGHAPSISLTSSPCFATHSLKTVSQTQSHQLGWVRCWSYTTQIAANVQEPGFALLLRARACRISKLPDSYLSSSFMCFACFQRSCLPPSLQRVSRFASRCLNRELSQESHNRADSSYRRTRQKDLFYGVSVSGRR